MIQFKARCTSPDGYDVQVCYVGTSEFKGNVTINNSHVNFNSNTGTAKFTGTSSQSLNGSSLNFAFKNLTINKSSNHVTANTTLSVDDVLTLTSGNIVTTSTNLITLKAGSSVSGASNSSFVDGPVKKVGNTAFEFPVGKSTKLQNIIMSSSSNITDAFIAEYFDSKYANAESLDTTLVFISECNYWMFNRVNGTSNVDINLVWNNPNCSILDSTTLVIAGWDNSKWIDLGKNNFSGTFTSGSIKNNYLISNFSYFTFGYKQWIPHIGQHPIGEDVQTYSSSLNCSHTSPDYNAKYNEQDYYIPDSNTPIKTILVNLNIFHNSNPSSPGYIETNFIQNDPGDNQRLFNIIDFASDQFQYVQSPSDPWTGVPTITDTKVRIEIANIYHYYNSTLESSSSWTALLNEVANNPERLNQMNIMFTNGSCCGNAWGFTVSPYLGSVNNNGIVTFNKWIAPSQQDNETGRHIAHEMGHALDLCHTYNSPCNEQCNTNSHDYLEDVFGSIFSPPVCLQGCNTANPNPTLSSTDHICTNNLMGGFNSTDYYSSPMQVGRMHRTLAIKNVRKYVKDCPYKLPAEVISSDETWDFDIRLYNSITVESDATLIIKCKVSMPDDGKIIIKRGAKLIIDGGIITSSCSMWQGIEVWGNKNYSQQPLTLNSHQGYVEIKNSGIIQNAIIGIAATRFIAGVPSPNYSGGIIVASGGSQMIDCQNGIVIYDYPNFINYSSITDCIFETTYILNDPSKIFESHVKLIGINGVAIKGNTFKNTAPSTTYWCYPSERGVGIKLFNSTCIIDPLGAQKNTFSKLYYGITVENSIGLHPVSVINNEFELCDRSIYILNGDYSKITGNQITSAPYFAESQICTIVPYTYGIYIDQTSNYICQNNSFIGATWYDWTNNNAPVIPDFGIIINNCGPNANKIYNNSFENYKIAESNQETNDGPTVSDGLKVNCNDFSDNKVDVQVIGLNTTAQIGLIQGVCNINLTPSPCARNRFFTNNCNFGDESWRMSNTSTQLVTYAYNSLSQTTLPQCPDNSLVSLIPCSDNFSKLNDCPDLTIGDPDLWIETGTVLDQEITSTKALFDGGSTANIVNQIEEMKEVTALKDTLLLYSPYLSDDALIKLIDKRDTFGFNNLISILIANSKLRSEITGYINNLEQGIRDSIIDTVASYQSNSNFSDSSYFVLQSAKFEKKHLSNYLINAYLTDSVYFCKDWQDSVFNILSIKMDPVAMIQLLNMHLQNQNIESAQDLLDSLQLIEGFENLVVFYTTIMKYSESDNGIYDIINNVDDYDKIVEISNDSTQFGHQMARALIMQVSNTKYVEPIINSSESRIKSITNNIESISVKKEIGQLNIYPNPSYGQFTIDLGNTHPTIENIQIYNSKGSQIQNYKSLYNGNFIDLDLTNQPPGIYFIKVNYTGNYFENKKSSIIK